MLNIKILTGYPEMFPGSLKHSLIGRALKENIFTIDTINLHDFGIDNRKSVDDEPFGGGPGMILRPDVVEKALFSISKKQSLNSAKIYLTPSGTLLNQKKLGYLSKLEEIIILKIYLNKIMISLFMQPIIQLVRTINLFHVLCLLF